MSGKVLDRRAESGGALKARTGPRGEQGEQVLQKQHEGYFSVRTDSQHMSIGKMRVSCHSTLRQTDRQQQQHQEAGNEFICNLPERSTSSWPRFGPSCVLTSLSPPPPSRRDQYSVRWLCPNPNSKAPRAPAKGKDAQAEAKAEGEAKQGEGEGEV